MAQKVGWEKKKMGEVYDVKDGTHDSPKYVENGYALITSKNLKQDAINFDNLNYITEEDYININKRSKVDIGDILFAMIGTIGNPVVVKHYVNFAIKNVALFKVPENQNSYFLKYYLSSKSVIEKMTKNAKGATQKFVGLNYLRNFSIPIPPLPIQHQIVSELDTLSDIITKKKQQLAALDALAQATFYDMFGDPVSNEKGWDEKKLGTLGVLGRGVSKNRPRNSPDLLGGITPLIQTGEIANAGMYLTEYTQTYSQKGLDQSRLWAINTLCITIAATIGKTSILTFEACFPDSVVGFTPNLDIIDVIFVYYFFLCIQKDLEDNAPQVAQKNINLEILNKIKVILPPIAIQSLFSEKIKAIEKQKHLINQSMSDVQQLFDYTMDKYFN